MERLQCSNCKSPNPANAQFCSQCGSALTIRCGICNEQNSLSAQHCQKCGVKLSTIGVGIMLPFAWQEQFRLMDWFHKLNEQGAKILGTVIREGKFPPFGEAHEPWIMVSPVDWEAGKIAHITFDRKKKITCDRSLYDLRGFVKMGQLGGYVVATNRRFAFVSFQDRDVSVVWYKDVHSLEWLPNRAAGFTFVRLATKSAKTIEFSIRHGGPNFIEVVSLLAASDLANKLLSKANYDMKTIQRENFLEILKMFFEAVSQVDE